MAMNLRVINYSVLTFLSTSLFAMSAQALPFNDDMVHSKNSKGGHNYYATGELMRQKPEGSVATGSMEYSVKDKEEAGTLNTPQKANKQSVFIGKRLFQVNCSPCHGNIEKAGYQMGPVATKFVAPPDITQEPYISERSDGYLYGVIHFGGMAVMPALGWKLSPTEHWDIINYVRHVQKTKSK